MYVRLKCCMAASKIQLQHWHKQSWEKENHLTLKVIEWLEFHVQDSNRKHCLFINMHMICK